MAATRRTSHLVSMIVVSAGVAGAAVILTVSARGQSSSVGAPASAPSFDAASIKPGDGARGIDFRFFPTRFVATALTLEQLILQAYGIESRELTGGPDWVRGDRFDVTATTSQEVSRERMQLMLRTLLAERFNLQIGREERTGTVYSLTARNAKNLKPPAKPDAPAAIGTRRLDENGVLSYRAEGHNATMAALAQYLAAHVRAPVTDETKLTGNYDFTISYTYDTAFGGLAPDPNVPTMFTALESQVGLKLTAGKGPVPVWVITRVAKPTAN
jgi:uncharacterized protein (TIGR03435 family)